MDQGVEKRIVVTSRWANAQKEFIQYCKKHGVTPEEYQSQYKRPVNWVVESLLSGEFDEDFFFTPADKRLANAQQEFDKILADNQIDPGTYEIQYGHKKSRAAFLLQCDQELDLEYWLTPCDEPSKEEIHELVNTIIKENGYSDIREYTVAMRHRFANIKNYVKSNFKEIIAGDPARISRVKEKFFVQCKDPAREPGAILSKAKKCVPPGRTAGLTILELGSKLKGLAKEFYPGGLDALNIDLGLSPTVHIPDFDSVRKDAPTTLELRVEEINRKIDRIKAQINPLRLDRLQGELVELQGESGELQGESVDGETLEKLEEAIEKALKISPGYLYFKQWSLPDATWFKVGITNCPERRDSEQNVLPVPAQTLYLVRLDSMEHARSVEKAIHAVLSPRRVVGAKNKEIFQLSGSDCKAVLVALRNLSDRLSQPELPDDE